MTEKTKNKILDAALKIFAKEGYKSATTRSIAHESGFSEITLFRKFETKENLFNEAMTCNHEKLQKNCLSIVKDLDQKFDDPKEFLENYIKRIALFFKDNFEFFNLMVTEEKVQIDAEMGEFTEFLAEFVANNMKKSDVNPEIITITVNTFIYMLNLESYVGNTTFDLDDRIKKFTDNLVLSI
jgi:AcrR family transcriptional regulator